jgi:hypothetical protein
MSYAIELNANCSYPDFSASSLPCSGHGSCIDSLCVCDSMWTGSSDWINGDGYDCHVSQVVMKVLWTVDLVFGMHAAFVSALPAVRKIYAKSKGFSDAMKNTSFEVLFLCICMQVFGFLPCAVIKLADLGTIGAESPITFALFGYITSVFYYLSACITIIQCNLAMKSMSSGESLELVKKVTKTIKYKVYMDGFVNCAAVALCLAIAGGDDLASREKNQLIFRICNFYRGFTQLFVFFQVTAMNTAVKTAFEGVDNAEGGQIVAVKKNMEQSVKDSIKAMIINGGGLFAVVFYQPFQSYFSYVIVIQWFIMNSLTAKVAKMFNSAPKKETSKVTPSGRKKSTQISAASSNETDDSPTKTSSDK